MKTLQSNFTTPEQSKRLLELGMPVDSADCYYSEFTSEAHIVGPLVINYSTFTEEQNLFPLDKMLPCWSVGRLIEIYLTCALEYHPYDDFYTETPSLHLMAFDKDRLIEEVIEIMSEDEMDFSKLEE